MERKSIKIWVALLVLPIPILIFTAMIQMFVRFVLGGRGSAPLNMISLLFGIVAVIMMLCLPIWIILLIKTQNYNKRLSSQYDNQSSSGTPLPPGQTVSRTQAPFPGQPIAPGEHLKPEL